MMKELIAVIAVIIVLFGSIFLTTSSSFTRLAETKPAELSHDRHALLSFEHAPEGFIAPPLHPAGIELQAVELAHNVYAILSGHPTVDNSGFIVGERGVLVIDSHISTEMADQIQSLVQEVTDKPIIYLVNTNFHGDHTFGNSTFPQTTTIISHQQTRDRLSHFEHEKEFMMAAVDHDLSVFGDVEMRLPDIVFEEYLSVDLGDRQVELYHFGHGNTPGDVVVYEPQSRTAWTGNFIVGEGTIPPIFEGRAHEYLESIRAFRNRLPVQTIIPGHGLMTDRAIFDHYEAYIEQLLSDVGKAVRKGWTVEETLERLPLELEAPQGLQPEFLELVINFVTGLHMLNVQNTYFDLKN